MQFKVPQFIEMESKIIGPLTFKQALYVGGAGGISYVLIKFLPTLLAVPLIGVVALFGWALAFFPTQKFGKPFVEITEAWFRYLTRGQLYIWRRSAQKPPIPAAEEEHPPQTTPIPKVSQGKLGSISEGLEVGKEE